MDQHGERGRSTSTGSQQPHIDQSHSPSPSPYGSNDPSGGEIGLGLGQHSNLDSFNGANAFLGSQPQGFSQSSISDPTVFDPNASFTQASTVSNTDPTLSFDSQSQNAFLSPDINDGDFSLFPPGGTQGDQFNVPLFEQTTIGPNDMTNMASPQPPHSPTPPHLLHPDSQHAGSAHQSPSFNQQQFSSPNHSRNASLDPQAALLPNQMGDWNQPQFQGHRRTPSEYSEVSSVSPSPNLISHDNFDLDHSGHSPLQHPTDPGLYQEVLNIGAFSLSDPQNVGRSPSHSPAVSPRIMPQQAPDLYQTQQNFGLSTSSAGYAPADYGMQGTNEAFPNLAANADGSQMAPPPSISIDFAPGHGNSTKPLMDQDSLSPPNRGRPASRPRAVTDPFSPGQLNRAEGSLSPAPGATLSPRSASSRSLSPLDKSASSAARRRGSTSSVPNNVIALRLADPSYQDSQENGPKRAQKHPATFQCTLCPKRFTRAYNLRSHLRTHTDERPFVCTVCGKAFARQHDRKRHESLHSGEKKFVCKGDLKAGGQWGCSRRFARADALGRHFRSEAGRICIKPLLDEEIMERQRVWQEQRMQENMAQNIAASQGSMVMDNAGYPMDAGGGFSLPAALLAQYPALAQMNWSQDVGSGMEDEMSGRSSYDASDFDDGDDGGYVSGPGTGYGEGGMGQGFGEIGYTSDLGGR